MNDLDLLILGAGPGGCAAAIMAARAGLKAALVERSRFPRNHPGEALHPGIRPLLKQLGIDGAVEDCRFVAVEGIWREEDGQRSLTRFGPAGDPSWLGMQAWRSEFDQVLLRRVEDVGVDVHQPVRAVELILDDKRRVAGVQTSLGQINARFVIDGTGGNHWLARRLGSAIEFRSPRLIARYGYDSSCEVPDANLPLIRNDADGWTWYARVRDNLYQWVHLSLRDRISNRSETDGRNTRSADVTWRCAERPAGPGYFLVGDAAAVLDPASSHGVLRAIMTGIMSAHVTKQILDDPSC